MKKGNLSEYFIAVASKRLSAVEASTHRSNQHEFNGVNALKSMLGTAFHKFNTIFIYLCDEDPKLIKETGFLTWYDAREKHPTRTEYRLYFPTNNVSSNFSEGDLLVIGRRPDDTLLVIVAQMGSTIESQILWLFGFSDMTHLGFSVKGEIESNQVRIEFAAKYILEQLGIEIEEINDNYLEQMLEKFNDDFPSTRIFSDYARSTLKEINILDNPDDIIIAWIEREEILFKTFERHLIGDRLHKGFNNDVDSFISFSLSVQNRRKSRAGHSLENHLEYLFISRSIKHSRSPLTEGKAKPDFLFPSAKEYHNPQYPTSLLTMLGVKSSCKDRWRQILAEADRIENKHLFTLEPSISENQTNEMISKNVQLVLPKSVHTTYTNNQKKWLITLETFINLVNANQTGSIFGIL